jgi:cytochrome c oxidase subunit 2
LGLLSGAGGANAEYALNLTRGVTSLSEQAYDLHMTILGVCIVIGIVVFGVMFYSILKHRKSKGAVAATFHESTKAEIAWTIVPILILVSMAIPATKTLLAMEDSTDPDMSIKITGIQWKWKYDYLDEDISFISTLAEDSNEARQRDSGVDVNGVEHYLLNVDKPLVVPVGRKIRFLITANDVIHAWWVPSLGWKKDAIPGFVNTAWARIDEPGTYRGQCAELCGKDHAFMPIVVEAKSEEDYLAWVKEQKAAAAAEAGAADRTWTMDELMAKGETVYKQSCAACHQANGQGVPGAFPGIAGSAIAKGDVNAHIDIVLNGKAGTAMAAFGGLLSDADIAAVVTYERNAFGNDTGDLVQPSTIKAAR